MIVILNLNQKYKKWVPTEGAPYIFYIFAELYINIVYMSKNRKKSFVSYTLLIGGILIIIGGWLSYTIVLKPNIFIPSGDSIYDFAIPSGATITDIEKKLHEEFMVKHRIGFTQLAKIAKLDERITPGLYTIHNGMNNKEIISLFRSGKRKTVRIQIRFNRYARDIMKDVAPLIEADYEDLIQLLTNDIYIDSLGFNRYTIICMFLMDTYFFQWNTDAKTFFSRMHREFHTYWNAERLQKAKRIGLSPIEVMILASIVDQETHRNDEKPRIAGVYINRLAIGMRLQADPTVKYAVGDFSLRRILRVHTQKESRYNTYIHTGLPPGPICTPSKAGIEAVLNYEKHNYYYFCARPDYSGYHMFAANYTEHQKNARIYQRWLNSQGIR